MLPRKQELLPIALVARWRATHRTAHRLHINQRVPAYYTRTSNRHGAPVAVAALQDVRQGHNVPAPLPYVDATFSLLLAKSPLSPHEETSSS